KHCLGLHHDNYLLTQSTARNLLVKVRDTSPDNCLDVLETALHQSALFVGQLTCEPAFDIFNGCVRHLAPHFRAHHVSTVGGGGALRVNLNIEGGAVCARVDDGVIVVGVFQVLKPTTKNYLAIRGRHGLVMSRVDVRVRTETQVNYFVVTDRCHYSSPSVSVFLGRPRFFGAGLGSTCVNPCFSKRAAFFSETVTTAPAGVFSRIPTCSLSLDDVNEFLIPTGGLLENVCSPDPVARLDQGLTVPVINQRRHRVEARVPVREQVEPEPLVIWPVDVLDEPKHRLDVVNRQGYRRTPVQRVRPRPRPPSAEAPLRGAACRVPGLRPSADRRPASGLGGTGRRGGLVPVDGRGGSARVRAAVAG